MGTDRSTKQRFKVARMAEKAAVPERPWLAGGPRYLVQPSVALACAPSLRAIAAALRDETRPVEEGTVNAVRAFLSDGGSPFFGREATVALREAVRLQQIVVAADPALLVQERVAIAAWPDRIALE